jgi:hypothetical protein
MTKQKISRDLILVAKIILAAKKRGDAIYDDFLREVCAINNREPAAVEADLREAAAR